MATTKAPTFASMLNEYLTYDLLEESFKEQSWLWNNCNIRKTWQGGTLIVPFQDHYANSVRMGALTDENDIGTAGYVRGSLAGYKEVYGSIFFNSRDLQIDHYRISEQNFISLLPQQLQQLMKYMRQTVSVQLLNGGALDSVASGWVGGATGVVDCLHSERFSRTQKVTLVDTTGPTTISGYVEKIDKSLSTLTIFDARTGGSVVDLTGLDDTTKIYIDDGNTTAFNSLKNDLLLAANGGSDTFAGVNKLDSTFSQAIQYDAGGATGTGPDWNSGTAVTGNDILTLIFDALRKNYQRGGEANLAIMSFKHFSAAMLALEKGSGGFRHVKPAVNFAGYSEITVGGVQGSIKLLGIREMDDDYIALVDRKSMDFHCGNMPFQPMVSPDGLKYFTKRATTGYTYITDIRLVGDFLYRNPWNATAIYNIPDYEISAIT
jgi:hypothetical protein